MADPLSVPGEPPVQAIKRLAHWEVSDDVQMLRTRLACISQATDKLSQPSHSPDPAAVIARAEQTIRHCAYAHLEYLDRAEIEAVIRDLLTLVRQWGPSDKTDEELMEAAWQRAKAIDDRRRAGTVLQQE